MKSLVVTHNTTPLLTVPKDCVKCVVFSDKGLMVTDMDGVCSLGITYGDFYNRNTVKAYWVEELKNSVVL